jgi:hypothetical protein
MNDKAVGRTKLNKKTKNDSLTACCLKSVLVQFVLLSLLIKLSHYVLLSFYIMFVKQLIKFYAITM